MTTSISRDRPLFPAASALARLTALPPRTWWVIAFALIVLKSWAMKGPGLLISLGDDDDAVRLVQVREFMQGAPWFDTTTMTMGGHAGMRSHWSRLIDLPLAALISFFRFFLTESTAELATRAIWPFLVLAPLLWTVFRTTLKLGNSTAGVIGLVLTALCPLALYQFETGRIDHHNAMIACTLIGLLSIWAFPDREKSWRVAGGLSGLALAVGYEALAPVAVISSIVSLWGLMDAGMARNVRAFIIAMVATLAIALLATTSPDRLLDIRCDALSLNLVVLASICGSGLVIALCSDARSSRRWIALVLSGAAGILAFGGLEPKCLAGPLGQLPPELKPIWLDLVDESRSIVMDVIRGNWEQSLGLIAFLLTGLAAQAARFRRANKTTDLVYLTALTAFVLLACWQYKYLAYASFAAIPPLALWIGRLPALGEVSAPAVQFAASVLVSQASLLSASEAVDRAFAKPRIVTSAVRELAETCGYSAVVRELDELPAGLIAAHIDATAYIPALTHHRVLSAPYHRIADAIIANHKLLSSRSADDAQSIIAAEGVDYIALCDGLDGPAVQTRAWTGTLRASLVAGVAPDFLTRAPLSNPNSVWRVWKVDKNKLSPRP